MDRFSRQTVHSVELRRDFACFEASPRQDFGELVSRFRFAALACLDKALSGAVCVIQENDPPFGTALYWGIRILVEEWEGGDKRLALVCSGPVLNEGLLAEAARTDCGDRVRVFRSVRDGVEWVTGRRADLMLQPSAMR